MTERFESNVYIKREKVEKDNLEYRRFKFGQKNLIANPMKPKKKKQDRMRFQDSRPYPRISQILPWRLNRESELYFDDATSKSKTGAQRRFTITIIMCWFRCSQSKLERFWSGEAMSWKRNCKSRGGTPLFEKGRRNAGEVGAYKLWESEKRFRERERSGEFLEVSLFLVGFFWTPHGMLISNFVASKPTSFFFQCKRDFSIYK